MATHIGITTCCFNYYKKLKTLGNGKVKIIAYFKEIWESNIIYYKEVSILWNRSRLSNQYTARAEVDGFIFVSVLNRYVAIDVRIYIIYYTCFFKCCNYRVV